MKQIHKEAIFKNGDSKRFEWNVEGKGIGSKLIKAVLDYIKEENWTVYPTCPFVGSFIKKNEEYQSLVKKGLRY